MRTLSLCSIGLLGLSACAAPPPAGPPGRRATAVMAKKKAPVSNAAKAKELAQRFIIADGHVDLPYRLDASKNADGTLSEDPSVRTPKGDFDFVRAREGGLDAPFMSIYVPAALQNKKGAAKAKADELIDLVEGLVNKSPDKFAMARTPAEVRANHAKGLISFPMGIENGAPLEQLSDVEHFYKRGVRYVTLTHSKDNAICDSSYDEARTHKGLSDYGKKVVAEMNRLGIMVDVSHVSDDVIRQVLAMTDVPVIASHSSARHFTPGFERNLSDELIKAIAAKDGVVLVNFGSTFVSQKSRDFFTTRRNAGKAFIKDKKLDADSEEGKAAVKAFMDAYDKKNTMVLASAKDVADHIMHIRNLVGVDFVGFGSDFDGVGPTLPTGLRDASAMPNLIEELLNRGLSEEEIEKVSSKNFFRVWDAVAKHATAKQ